MASVYTYDQFEKEAKKAGLYDQFSQADLNLAKQNADAGMSILKYKQDYANAGTDEARALANLGAENVRSSYGNYTGGGDGGSFHLNSLSPSSFQQEAAPEYENRYDDRTQELINTILNREAFQYDPAADPVYQAYQKQYAREGQRAAQNALGAASLGTGGVPSSYAITAASQAGDYYGAQMADKIPQLYRQAYEKYQDEYNRKLSDLGMLQEAEQADYNKFLNRLSQYNTDRQFDYAKLLDEIDSQTLERQEALAKAELAGNYGDYSFLNDMGIDTSGNAADWERKYQLALLGAQYGDKSGLEGLGIDTGNDPSDYERRYELALLAAEMGDYSKLRELGVDTSNNSTDYERRYQLALLKAEYGDYSGLRELGVNMGGEDRSGGYNSYGGGSGSEDDGKTAGNDEGTPASGMPDDTFNAILSEYPGMIISPAGFADIQAKHPGVTEGQLRAEGFVVTASGTKGRGRGLNNRANYFQ